MALRSSHFAKNFLMGGSTIIRGVVLWPTWANVSRKILLTAINRDVTKDDNGTLCVVIILRGTKFLDLFCGEKHQSMRIISNIPHFVLYCHACVKLNLTLNRYRYFLERNYYFGALRHPKTLSIHLFWVPRKRYPPKSKTQKNLHYGRREKKL
jgi:hypothetical protein